MAVEITMPDLDGVTEARILKWLVSNGDYVARDQAVLEYESSKAGDTLPAPAAGLVTISVPADQTVPTKSVVGSITPAPAPAGVASPKPAPAATPASVPAPTSGDKILSPAAERVAAENRIDPASITGTGRGGRVTKEDALNAASSGSAKSTNGAAVAAPPAPSSTPAAPAKVVVKPGQRETRVKMTMLRKTIAERLVYSQQSTATLTTFNEADMSAIMDLRAKYKDAYTKKHGVGLGFMSFFVKATIEALKTFPAVNARIDGQDIVYQNFYDISVAVSTEKGLMTPIIRDADVMSFAEIEKKIIDLATRAKENKIKMDDLQGGTFTITNGGIFGSMLSTPIINPPQTAILGMHSIQKRAVVVNDQIVIRPMMYLALSYDHRLIDGREAVQFLVKIKECLESPERMLLEV